MPMTETRVETVPASGHRTSGKDRLETLLCKMKAEPEAFVTEVDLIYSQFKSSRDIFQKHAVLSMTTSGHSDVAKELGDRAMWLAHLTPCYPKQLVDYPKELTEFLRSSACVLPSQLRVTVTRALVFLVNNKIVAIKDTLSLFMELQLLKDKDTKKLASSHVIKSIKVMNQKHKDETQNRPLQSILFSMLQEKDDGRAMRSLVTLCSLYGCKVWFDDTTANAICRACFHPSSRIVTAALSFLLGYEKIEQDSDSDESSDEGETAQQPHALISRAAIYKAKNTGSASSKKKKNAKLQRAIRSLKKQQRRSSGRINNFNSSSPLVSLQDPQEFAEELLSQLHKKSEYTFKTKMMIVKVVARAIGLHQLILLNFYPLVSAYIHPRQRDVINILASAVQACHDMVPPDAVELLLKNIVDQFVHDRAPTQSIVVGLNAVREICLRIPLLMTEDLLQDLVLYKKSHEKAVSSAACSLISLFREICPSLLKKKDRGRPINPRAQPKAYGEVTILSDVLGADLLRDDDSNDDVSNTFDEDGHSFNDISTHDECLEFKSEVGDDDGDDVASNASDKDDHFFNDLGEEDANGDDDDTSTRDECLEFMSEVGNDDGDNDVANASDEDDNSINDLGKNDADGGSEFDSELWDDDDDYYYTLLESEEDDDDLLCDDNENEHVKSMDGMSINSRGTRGEKRKFVDFDGDFDSASQSPRAFKSRAGANLQDDNTSDAPDGILSDADFQRIKEENAKKEAELVLARHGLLKKGSVPKFKIPSSEQLRLKRVDGYSLAANIRRKMTKEQRKALVKAGREETGKYRAKAAIKRQKTGGLSNQQKEHKKAMPLAAMRSKIKRSKHQKKRRGAGKQFRGRKAWK